MNSHRDAPSVGIVAYALRILSHAFGKTPSQAPLSATPEPASSPIARIVRMCFPQVLCPETALCGGIAAIVLLRSSTDVALINAQTHVEASIIARDRAGFRLHLFRYWRCIIPVVLLSSGLKLALAELKTRLRTRMTTTLLSRYFSHLTYYRLGSVDARLANIESLLTNDVERAAESLVELFIDVLRPSLDILLFASKLGGGIGWSGPAMLCFYMLISGGIFTALRAPTAKLTAQEQKLEGEYRAGNARVIANAEEIAFYAGGEWEKQSILAVFGRLTSLLRASKLYRHASHALESLIGKYLATSLGFYIISRPFLDPEGTRVKLLDDQPLVAQYYTHGRLLLKLASALGRLVLAGREAAKLTGYAGRLGELMHVLDDLERGVYVRSQVAPSDRDAAAPVAAAAAPGADSSSGHPTSSDSHDSCTAPLQPQHELRLLNPGARVIEVDGCIRADAVSVVAPNGALLLRSVSFCIMPRMNTLFSGPNGSGKSSLFRVLAGLWPQQTGTLCRPPEGFLFYLPQRPYCPIGTLRDQVTYPTLHGNSSGDVSANDAAVLAALQITHLSYLAESRGGLDAVADWTDVLSGGEKQRLAFARLLYHRPAFAALDECTSAVSLDVEDALYAAAIDAGITLLAISHRTSVWKHFGWVVVFDGEGACQFRQLSPGEIASGEVQ